VAQLYELYKETNKPLVDSESWWKFKIGHLYINFVIYNFFCEFLTITIWIGLHIHWNTTTSVVPLLTWSPHVRLIEGLNIDQVKPKTIKLAFTLIEIEQYLLKISNFSILTRRCLLCSKTTCLIGFL
jgi:hypothetical protein